MSIDDTSPSANDPLVACAVCGRTLDYDQYLAKCVIAEDPVPAVSWKDPNHLAPETEVRDV